MERLLENLRAYQEEHVSTLVRHHDARLAAVEKQLDDLVAKVAAAATSTLVPCRPLSLRVTVASSHRAFSGIQPGQRRPNSESCQEVD